MRKNDMHKILAGLLAMTVIVCAVVIGWAAAEQEHDTEVEPLVINTTNDVLLTVIDEQGQEVFPVRQRSERLDSGRRALHEYLYQPGWRGVGNE